MPEFMPGPAAGAMTGPAGPDDNGSMLGAAVVTARTAAFVLVGFFLFAVVGLGPGYRVAEIAVYALAGVLMVAWTLIGRAPEAARLDGRRFGGGLPWVLGALAVVTAAGAGLPGGGPLIVLAVIAVISAGSRTSLTAAWITAGLAATALIATGTACGVPGWTTVGNVAALLVGLLGGFGRRAYRVQAEQNAVLLTQAEQLRNEQARAATLDERARIAREIHDVLAHSLGALGVQIQLAQAVLTDTHDETRAVELLGQAHRMATDGLAETRRAVHALRGQTPPLPEGLAGLGADHQRRHGARVAVAVTGEPHPLPPDVGLALTRTAQEALVNTAKHAPHQPVGITLDYAEAGTTLTVTSRLASGAGAGPELATVNGGYGLAGIRERLLLLGGTLGAGADDGEWVVTAWVPQRMKAERVRAERAEAE
jgi:signal transduction histidine kinase